MSFLSTHVLDTARGIPGCGIGLKLFSITNNHRKLLFEGITNPDGRCDKPLLAGNQFQVGLYELDFFVEDYFLSNRILSAVPSFFTTITLRFFMSNKHQYCHIPLLLSPYAYSTYKGS